MLGKHSTLIQITSGISVPLGFVYTLVCATSQRNKSCFSLYSDRSCQHGHRRCPVTFQSLGNAPTECLQNLSQFPVGEH